MILVELQRTSIEFERRIKEKIHQLRTSYVLIQIYSTEIIDSFLKTDASSCKKDDLERNFMPRTLLNSPL